MLLYSMKPFQDARRRGDFSFEEVTDFFCTGVVLISFYLTSSMCEIASTWNSIPPLKGGVDKHLILFCMFVFV